MLHPRTPWILALVAAIFVPFSVSLPVSAPIVSEVDVPVDAGPVIIVLEQSDQNQVDLTHDSPSFEVGSDEPEDFVPSEQLPVQAISDVPNSAEKKPAPPAGQKPGAPPKPGAGAPAKPQKPPAPKPQAPKPQAPKPQAPKPQAPKPQKPVPGKPQKPATGPQKPSGKPQKPPAKPEKPGGARPQRPTPKPQRPSGRPNNPGKPGLLKEGEDATTYFPVEYDYELTTSEPAQEEVSVSAGSVAVKTMDMGL